MRVLISASSFPLHTEDVRPRFVYDLAQALVPFCEITALAPDAPDVQQQEQLGAVAVQRFPYLRPRHWQSLAYGDGMRENWRASVSNKLQLLPYIWAQTQATQRLIRDKRIDIVNSHWMIPQGLSSALARGSPPRFRHVLSIHAADVYMLNELPFGPAVAKFILNRTDYVFADGSQVRDTLDHLLGYPAQVVLQPMGAQVELFRAGPGLASDENVFPQGYVLFLGRLVEKKGGVYLLRAMPKVLERYPNLGLIVLGYGPLENELRREVTRLALDRSVVFAGRKSHEEIGRYLRSCRLAVVPSIIDQYGETEGMPTVVVEAMAAGARVVASAVDGIPDIIRHGENGWLCREKDPDDLAEKILLALVDPAASEIILQAQETANLLDWSQVAARYMAAFHSVTGQNSDIGKRASA